MEEVKVMVGYRFQPPIATDKECHHDRESRGVVLQHGEMRGGRLSDGNGITIR